MEENELMDRLDEAQTVLFVHTYGTERGFNELFERVKDAKPETVIIDDKCLCMIDASPAQNSLADLVLYSTGAKKQVDLGGGGFGFVADRWDYFETEESNCLNNCVDWNWQDLFFLDKGQMRFDDELCCKITNIKSHRNLLNSVYKQRLPKEIQFPEPFQQWRFNIWVDNKEEVLRAIFYEGLFASGHYKPFGEHCENAKYLFHHVINLFEDEYFTEEQAIRTCEIINRVLARKNVISC